MMLLDRGASHRLGSQHGRAPLQKIQNAILVNYNTITSRMQRDFITSRWRQGIGDRFAVSSRRFICAIKHLLMSKSGRAPTFFRLIIDKPARKV
jgi:hypothetical protein